MGPAWVFYIILNLSVLGQVNSPSLEACNITRDWTYQGWYKQIKDELEDTASTRTVYSSKYNLWLTPCRWCLMDDGTSNALPNSN